MLSIFQSIHEYITAADYYTKWYHQIVTTNEDDEVKKLAIIAQNEFLYIDFKKPNPRFHVRLSENLDDLTMTEAYSILIQATDLLTQRPEVADNILSGHNSRVYGQSSAGYKKWKQTIRVIFAEHEYCFKCGKSGPGLHVDHIKSHNSFRNLRRAFNLGNGQMLCQTCNLAKNPDDQTDYRTKEHLLLVRAFIQDTGKKFL